MLNNKRITAPDIVKKKGNEKIVMLTAYDYIMANLMDPFVDIILVGDSLGCVVRGEDTTLGVTLDETIYHSKMVSRAAQHALVIGDLPFGSYQVNSEDAFRATIRLIKEAGVGGVKLEGGSRIQKTIDQIVSSGVPVMGHIGLTPQSYHVFGGNKVQGKDQKAEEQLIRDAKAVEEAGAFSVVLEAIPSELAGKITAEISIPTIGIGAGTQCNGQVLVINDMIGLNSEAAKMRFNKEYCVLRDTIQTSVQEYANEVRQGNFPEHRHCYS
jgi:3-methyl-2-oxobutanoate hydroxymethyltransferase